MKNILYILSVAMAVLTGCVKEETDNMPAELHEVMINTIPEWKMNGEPGGDNARTRGTVICNRYVLELYSEDTYTNKVDTKTSSDGNFLLTLDRSEVYYCLLWADNDALAATYDVTSLKAVTLKSGQSVAEAFCGKLTIRGKQASYSVSLNRTVARVNLKETGKLPKGTLAMKYSQKPEFNVANGTTSGTIADFTSTVTIAADVAGTEDIPVVLNNDQPVYVLASGIAEYVKFTFQYKDDVKTLPEAEFSTTVPIQANYNTNIMGHYTVAPPEVAKIGDYYFSNGTYGSDGSAGTPVGVVFWVDPADGTKGKIVSLDEGSNISYTAAINWKSANKAPSGKQWYCPSKEEVQYIYCALIGVPPVTWNTGYCPSKENEVPGARDLFNSKLSMPITKTPPYFSSTTFNQGGWDYMYTFYMGIGSVTSTTISDSAKVRAVSAF